MNSLFMLYLGIGCISAGLIGLIVSIFLGKAKKKAVIEKLEKEY